LSLLAGAACVAALLVAGWWPMRAWAPGLAGPTLTGRMSVAFALGAAIAGLVLVLLSALGMPAHPAVLGVLALGSALLLRGRPGAEPAAPASPAATADPAGGVARLPRGFAALLLVVALVSTGASVGLPFRSDGSKFWAPRARDLAEVGAAHAPSLHDPGRLGVHRNYPLLVPALMAPAFTLSPPDAVAGPKLVLAALTLALLGVLAVQLLRCGARGGLLLLVFATLPFLVGTDVRESAVSGGFVDSAEALFLLLVVAGAEALRRGAAQGADRTLLVTGLFGAALASTKLEGAAELGLVAIAWLLTGPLRRPVLPWLALVLLLWVPTLVIRAGASPEEAGFTAESLTDGSTLLARGVPVLAGVGSLLLDVSCFGLLPPLVLLWLLPRAGAPEARGTRTFALWLLAGAAGFLLVSYLATTMHTGRHIHTSAHRLAWHWLPALALLAARVRADGGERPASPARVPS